MLSGSKVRVALIAGAVAVALTAFTVGRMRASESAVVLPPPVVDLTDAKGEQTIVIAGGCFWGVQAVFQHTQGVISAVSGYAGDSKENANYKLVSTGRTRHAEAVQIKFDPQKISYGKILQIFFSVAHDPTQIDQQGPDMGPQYRSAIFYGDAEQKRVAEAYVKQLDGQKSFRVPIATKIDRLTAFYPAEAYHQDYATLNPNQPYILYHDRPKIESLKRLMPDTYRATPVLVRSASR
jgi:peptide-methionine (S)-S-oxide reductase